MRAIVLVILCFFAVVSVAAAEPCYISHPDTGACLQRFWQDPDTFILESYPSSTTYNPSSGIYQVNTCHMLPGNIPKIPECMNGDTLILPEPITLRQWCIQLKNVSLQAFTSFYDLGICPLV